MTDAELFNLFIGEQATMDEVVEMKLGFIEHYIAEQRRAEHDDLPSNYKIACAIWRYAHGES
jgi:hypothetical protein